jgi:hypothetical protein
MLVPQQLAADQALKVYSRRRPRCRTQPASPVPVQMINPAGSPERAATVQTSGIECKSLMTTPALRTKSSSDTITNVRHNPSTARTQQAAASMAVVVPQVTPPVIESCSLSREAFISRIAQQTVSILAAPATVKRCTKTLSAGQTPRRSRCLAGVKAEFNMSELERRSKKKAMRALGIITEQESHARPGDHNRTGRCY